MNNDNYDIELKGDEKLHLKYDYLPYSYHRIVAILRTYFNAELQLVRGYKEGRYIPNYKQRYQIKDIDTKKVLVENVHLEDLRYFFADKNIPLYENTVKRNPKAEQFMNIIYALNQEQQT